MSDTAKIYDVAIIGGGLAGLCLSIQLSRQGYDVIVFEKEKYPYHKVCGEYISFECWNFLEELGVPLSDWDLPIINTLQVSAPNGNKLLHNLPLGGFGISRYKLDAYLARLSRNAGTQIMEEAKVDNAWFTDGCFHIQQGNNMFKAKLACGTYGKRSNLDVKYKRDFIQKKASGLNNYVAVKYHVRFNQPDNVISLHNFENGYCGISKVENDRYCLCYLTTAQNLKKADNNIKQLEQGILSKNPHLHEIFSGASFLFAAPLTISQISFENKTQIEHHMLMVGDAAGMITPLCGNGMSMAIHSSKLSFEQIGRAHV